jgi:TnpA family transposase
MAAAIPTMSSPSAPCLGFQFAPRIPELKSRRLYSFGKAAAYPSLEPLIARRINTALIRAHWPEILRVAVSIHTAPWPPL